ncbi:MAG: hypothetical protein M3437_14635 [Chloroflexota bacterium]|nr:hypothetical protein [Chloroflexota bacterium]MDQ5865571.1 hypothetical protein [Chloroflexota bacterium]
MDAGRPTRVRRVGYQEEPEPAPAINPMRIIAGLAAILFPVCNVLPIPFINFDIAHYHPPDNVAGLLFLLAYILLLPLVYVLYQELRAVSRPLGTWVSVLGVGVPVGVATGVIFGLNSASSAILTVTCLSLWISLSGYVAFSQRILGRVWAAFSMAISALALVAATVNIMFGFTSSAGLFIWGIYALAILIWVLWTGVMFMRRARMTPAGA